MQGFGPFIDLDDARTLDHWCKGREDIAGIGLAVQEWRIGYVNLLFFAPRPKWAIKVPPFVISPG